MKKKTWAITLSLILMLCLLLAACGQEAADSGAAADNAGSNTDVSSDDPPAGDDSYPPEDGPVDELPPDVDPTLIEPTGAGDIWLRYGDNGLIGTYDMANDCWVTEPCYEAVLPGAEGGLYLAKKDGYYGYIDLEGTKVIGFMFASANSFVQYGEEYYAVVGMGTAGNNGLGLIDRTGNFLISPEYADFEMLDQYIKVTKAAGYASYDCYGLFRYNGDLVLPANNTILHILESGYILAASQSFPYEDTRLDLFDGDGNQLNGMPGEYADWGDISYYANGVFALEYVLDRNIFPNRVCIFFVNENLEFVSDIQFMGDAKFNELGVVVAQVSSRYSAQNWIAMDRNGTVLCDLPENSSGHVYEYANEFCAYGKIRPGTQKTYNLYVYKTGEMTEWGEVYPIEGTNYICVKDKDTQLWGLYDGDTLYSAVCNDISWKKTDTGYKFTMTRGAEKTEYIPVN